MIEIQDYPIYTPIPSGCKILGTDETGATKNFSIQDVMKTLKSSDYTDNPLTTPIPSGCKLLGANASGETKNFYIQDVMKTLKSSDYTDAPITANCKLIGSDANGDTKSFLFSDIISSVNTKAVRLLTTSNTLLSSDSNNIIYFTISANAMLAITTNALTPIPIGTEVTLIKQAGSFTVTIAPSLGVFINSGTSNVSLGSAAFYAVLTKVSTNEWVVYPLS
jgi:hypothetical protein